MADWLKQCGIRTVALQSTGVYWIAVYDILEEAGLEVYLVNARETKNLPGRKSDVQEKSMVDEAAHLWLIAELVSAIGGDPQAADLLAAAQ
jgi:transposase